MDSLEKEVKVHTSEDKLHQEYFHIKLFGPRGMHAPAHAAYVCLR